MPLNGWIGLGEKAREKHVFTLPAIVQVCRRESKTQIHSPSRAGPRRGALKTTTGKNLTGMSESCFRQALTRQAGFALHGANQSQELVTITRMTGAGRLL